MSRLFETKEITKLLDALIGKVEAVGETNEDGRRLGNLKTLIDVTNWCLDGLQFAMASGCGRAEYSMAKIGYTAQCALDEYRKWITEVLEEGADCDTCRYGQNKHKYAHICNECGVGINNYTPQLERNE